MRTLALTAALLAGCGDKVPEDLSDCELNDEIYVSAASIDGDTLTVDVSHGGGCEDHSYAICWDGSVIEEVPVGATLIVWHDANNDSCEAEISTQITVDLSEMQDMSDGEIAITVAGTDSQATATYTY